MTTNHFEFAPARKMMADLLQTADRCRLERIAQIDRVMTGMRETLKRAEDTVRTCPAEIAKLEAERAALSELTPEAAVREMLPPPPPAPNRFDCRECGQGVAADEDGCCATCGRACAAFEDGKCVIPFPEEEEESNAAAIHRAHREALAQQSQPAPPALLDLRTVKIGTKCEALDTLTADGKAAGVEKGQRFTVTQVDGFLAAETTEEVHYIDPMQPARVVKHACPRCDEGMREIVIEWDQDSVQTATRLGADGTAIVEIGSESTIYTPNAYRFVRADVPPPSEWCDGKGAG